MRIDHISVYPVLLRFSSGFSHSLRKTNSVKNIIDYFLKDFITNKVYYGAMLPLAGKQNIVEVGRLIKNRKKSYPPFFFFLYIE